MAALAVLVVAALAAGVGLAVALRASLPRLDGWVALAGLGAEVVVERDELGVPTVRAASFLDAARAIGFVHAQDRFFQMDLTRRQAAGELAELVGEGALPLDRRARVHRFRWRAGRALAALRSTERDLVRAYAAGVNAGLADLGAPPLEYLLLRTRPREWDEEDLFLVVYAMYLVLNDERARREAVRGVIHDVLGPEMLAFLSPDGTEWDAPLAGGAYPTPEPPPPRLVDLRRSPAASAAPGTAAASPGEAALGGSNNWAVAGWRSAAGGAALLANDMHLAHSVPNIWYRAAFVYPDRRAPGGERRLAGVTLPGAPLVIAGSNGQVAWGFTNTWGDWEDLVVLEEDSERPGSYRTAAGWRRFERHREVLGRRGGAAEDLEILETVWGPVVDRDAAGRRRVLRWVAHDRAAVNLELGDLASAATVAEAVAVASRAGAPAQNFVAGDAAGDIAWTVMGPIPRRFGHDGRLPSSWAAGDRGWDGYLDPEEHPRIVAPASGRIWTANNRVAAGEDLDKIGLGTYRLGARARQIRLGLEARERFTEADFLALQLDDRALLLARWHELLARVAPVALAGDEPRRRRFATWLADWSGRAAVDSVAYRAARRFRDVVSELAFGPVVARCRAAAPDFDLELLVQLEGPLWRLVERRPLHLLDPRFASWDELLAAAARRTAAELESAAASGAPTWGERNRARVRHPLSRFVPGAGRWLDMPPDPLPGDRDMPRFQAPAEGASERFVVSPGREADGFFHMPAGQSGHPLSPFYRRGHRAWVEGAPTPFLPGPPRHRLVLAPGR